jgi:hypothetical protein
MILSDQTSGAGREGDGIMDDTENGASHGRLIEGLAFKVEERSFAGMTHYAVTANGVDCGGSLDEERALVQKGLIEEAAYKLIQAGVLRMGEGSDA